MLCRTTSLSGRTRTRIAAVRTNNTETRRVAQFTTVAGNIIRSSWRANACSSRSPPPSLKSLLLDTLNPDTLQARIAMLESELAKVEAAGAGHRADFERERDRADKLLSEVLRATVDLIGAKEATARNRRRFGSRAGASRGRNRSRLRPCRAS